MPTGTPIRLPPAPGVILGEPLEADKGGLLPESHNIINRFGHLDSRDGPVQLGQTLIAGEAILGAFWLRDQGGVVRLVAGTTRRWWEFNNTTRLWDDLSAGVLLTGTPIMPVTFQYWEEGNFQYVLGVNDVDIAKEWQVGSAAYADIATGYIAKSMCATANRVFYGNVTIGGIRFPTMVAWSQTGLRGVNPAGARTKLFDSGDHIVAVRTGHRLSAYIYREKSIWIATAQAASDAQAFGFDRADDKPGPIGPMAVGDDAGQQDVYFGSDLNIWTFDGHRASIVAATSDLLKGRFNPAVGSLTCAAFRPQQQEYWILLPLDGELVPTWVLVYSVRTGGVFFQKLHDDFPMTMLATWQVELETPTHLLPDVPTHELPDVPTHQLGFVSGQETLLGATDEAVYTFDGVTDVGLPIDIDGFVLLPTPEGGEHVFDAVEIMAEPPGAPITVSVMIGHTFDTLREIALGVIDPSIPPPEDGPLEYFTGGPNVTIVRADTEVRARFVVLRFRAQTTQRLRVRRVELFTYARRMAT